MLCYKVVFTVFLHSRLGLPDGNTHTHAHTHRNTTHTQEHTHTGVSHTYRHTNKDRSRHRKDVPLLK